jgi:hypothetical protein
LKSKNPLDLLCRDIQREIDAQKHHGKQRPDKPLTCQSTYANPENWSLGSVVSLIHATDGPIGLFQEYFHKLSPSARRLLPAAEGLQAVREELVFGDYWLHPRFTALSHIEPDSEAEERAIRRRFTELMDEWDA